MKEYIDAFSEKDAVLEPSIVKTFEKSVHSFTFNVVVYIITGFYSQKRPYLIETTAQSV